MSALLPGEPRFRRAAALRWAIVSGLLTLVVFGAASGYRFRLHIPGTGTPPLLTQPQGRPPGDPDVWGDLVEEMPEREPLNLTWLLIVLGILVLAVIAILVIRYLRRRIEKIPLPDIEEPEVATEPIVFNRDDVEDMVANAQARMRDARNPTDAVVAGWVAFEDAAAARGWVRKLHQTTTEFTADLLAESPAPAEPVAVLRGLYQQVRFGGLEPTNQDVEKAQNALTDIAQHLKTLPKKNLPQLQTPTSTPVITASVSRNKWGED